MRGFRSALIIAAMVGCGGTQENANQADPGTIAGTMRDPAPAAYSQVGGSIIPLYSWPTDANGNVAAAWSFVASEQQKWSSKGIGALIDGGCKVAGYVYTQYGKRSLTKVERDIRNWRTWYPQVTALFLDEMSNTAGKESYYSTLTSYAKSIGFDFVVGNPGTSTIPSYIGTVDTLVIYENTAVPTSFPAWQASYSRYNFATLSYAVSSSEFPASQVTANRASVAYQYVTDDGAPPDRNPWDSVSTYLDTLLSLLSP